MTATTVAVVIVVARPTDIMGVILVGIDIAVVVWVVAVAVVLVVVLPAVVIIAGPEVMVTGALLPLVELLTGLVPSSRSVLNTETYTEVCC